MLIKVNNKSNEVKQPELADIKHVIRMELRRYSEQVTRLEAYICDVNGPKGGIDKECTLEGRLAGKDPIAVSANSRTMRQAVQEAAVKLNRKISSLTGKRATRKRAAKQKRMMTGLSSAGRAAVY